MDPNNEHHEEDDMAEVALAYQEVQAKLNYISRLFAQLQAMGPLERLEYWSTVFNLLLRIENGIRHKMRADRNYRQAFLADDWGTMMHLMGIIQHPFYHLLEEGYNSDSTEEDNVDEDDVEQVEDDVDRRNDNVDRREDDDERRDEDQATLDMH